MSPKFKKHHERGVAVFGLELSAPRGLLQMQPVTLTTVCRGKPEESTGRGKEINSLIDLTKTETVGIILAGRMCPKATEASLYLVAELGTAP